MIDKSKAAPEERSATKRCYSVYVIRLKSSVWDKSRKYRDANPLYQPGKPHVYVGSTARTPAERFDKHLRGGRGASRLVARFGKRLFPYAYEHLPTRATRAGAERLEARTTERLRGRGWGVWSNAQPLEEGLAQREQGTLS